MNLHANTGIIPACVCGLEVSSTWFNSCFVSILFIVNQRSLLLSFPKRLSKNLPHCCEKKRGGSGALVFPFQTDGLKVEEPVNVPRVGFAHG